MVFEAGSCGGNNALLLLRKIISSAVLSFGRSSIAAKGVVYHNKKPGRAP